MGVKVLVTLIIGENTEHAAMIALRDIIKICFEENKIYFAHYGEEIHDIKAIEKIREIYVDHRILVIVLFSSKAEAFYSHGKKFSDILKGISKFKEVQKIICINFDQEIQEQINSCIKMNKIIFANRTDFIDKFNTLFPETKIVSYY